MLEVLIGIIAVVAGIIMIVRRPGPSTPTSRMGRLLYGPLGGIVALGIGLFMLASTSFIFVDANQVGHLKRIYAFKELPPGRIIALNGEKGPQAEILGPGFHFIPLVREALSTRIARPGGDGLSGALAMARELLDAGQAQP